MKSFHLWISFILCVASFSAAEARKWKPKPSDLASDYVQIQDNRSNGEFVLILWMAPESIDEKTPGSAEMRSVLSEFMFIGVAHGSFSPLGRFESKSVQGVNVELADGKARQPLQKESLPPTVIGMLSVLQAGIVQSLGPVGQSFQVHVFEGKDIQSCGKGRFWVVYNGERYDYNTPIPGCP
jgi:hypothetical protein